MSAEKRALAAACRQVLCLVLAACGGAADGGGGRAGTGEGVLAAGSGAGRGVSAGGGGPAAGGGIVIDNPVGIAGISGGIGGAGGAMVSPPLGCRNLQCQQKECASGETTISGKVYDPAGKNPLYNVAVFVPNAPVEPLQLGASCDCEKLYTGKPVVSTLTDAKGEFTLKNVPAGADIPLVIQIGKWRRQFTLPQVAECSDTRVPDKMLSLPRNHMQGDIPRIAISTGAADTLECLLRRVGLDAAEYIGGASGDNRIHIFQGSRGNSGGGGMRDAPNTMPAAPSSTIALWNSKDELMKYDILLLSCEGAETKGMNQQALHDYASAGGRVFASHFHYSWFNSGPYASENLATWSAGSNAMGDIGAKIVTDFPKGMALHGWLQSNNALVNGELQIKEARHNADVSMANTVSQAWILANQSANPPGATQYFSFNTPTDTMIGPDGKDYCGRVVFSDLHVGAASNDSETLSVPASCTDGDLSPQEKALEFMLFDLSACVIPDDRPPVPPPVVL
ncbi:MAG TPA: carboxypeptidase regulatory-like domain-containing protein [Polyangiales bacterium]|nr:carboxypeptidase regulatory-like domain-containing protein [Polyangiales bacterium]